jgi:hypothetical protein
MPGSFNDPFLAEASYGNGTSRSNSPISEAVRDQPNEDLTLTASLEDLQTDEQRRILDTVAQVRKCGLESILSLPQLVVCGDQSAGKSSVLEALTEIPFPREDNLCTRFATEIILRRSSINRLTIKNIPDQFRSAAEQARIRAFEESIEDFKELPEVMRSAMRAIGMDEEDAESGSGLSAFARDVLSIEVEGTHLSTYLYAPSRAVIGEIQMPLSFRDTKLQVIEVTLYPLRS